MPDLAWHVDALVWTAAALSVWIAVWVWRSAYPSLKAVQTLAEMRCWQVKAGLSCLSGLLVSTYVSLVLPGLLDDLIPRSWAAASGVIAFLALGYGLRWLAYSSIYPHAAAQICRRDGDDRCRSYVIDTVFVFGVIAISMTASGLMRLIFRVAGHMIEGMAQ